MTHEFAEPPAGFEEITGLKLAAKLLTTATGVNEADGLLGTIAASMLLQSVRRTVEVNSPEATASIMVAVLLLAAETLAPLARQAGQEVPDVINAAVALIEAGQSISCTCGQCPD